MFVLVVSLEEPDIGCLKPGKITVQLTGMVGFFSETSPSCRHPWRKLLKRAPDFASLQGKKEKTSRLSQRMSP